MGRYNAEQFEPPAPVILAKVIKPNSIDSKESKAKIDTGADMTVIPKDWIREWGLIPARYILTKGYNGRVIEQLSYYVNFSFEGHNFDYVEVIPAERGNVLIGRNILNKLKLVLDGKKLHFGIFDPW